MATSAHTDSAGAVAATTPEGATSHGSTRERILDIAMELFIEQGYDKTSIRDIAERLGTTKAALYYHFKSKADILLELHLRLHRLGKRLLDELEALPDGAARAAAWPSLIDELIAAADEHRDLIQLHQRNHHALEQLHASGRDDDADDEDIERQVRRLLANHDIPAEMRVRMACSVGAAMSGLLSDGFVDDVPHERRIDLVREIVGSIFRDRG